MYIQTLAPVVPEILLAVGAMALLMLGAFRGQQAMAQVTWGSVLLLLVALFLTLRLDSGTLFNGAITIDTFAILMKVLVLAGSALAIIMSVDYMRAEKFEQFEYPVLIVLSSLGMLLMVSATDLIVLYLGLELQSLALYVLAAIRRDSARASEAGLKYFVLGALSSGMLLYGCSLIYGFAGTTSFAGIASVVTGEHASLGVLFGLVFILAGLIFKISGFPFHMWTPDVYEGAPTPITAFFAMAPKMAAMALIIRVLVQAFGDVTSDWQQIIVFVSIGSMVLGAFAAIGQNNIKRLLAYSSIANMGFALVGLAAGTTEGVSGVLLYMVIYLIMTAGTFAAVLSMRRGGAYVEDISDLAGLARSNPGMAFFLGVMMFSLAGIPPLAGFFAKFYVFLAAVEAGLFPLAIIGVLASVVGAYYYLRIVKIMYFDEPAESLEPVLPSLGAILAVTGVIIIAFIAYPSPLITVTEAAANSLF